MIYHLRFAPRACATCPTHSHEIARWMRRYCALLAAKVGLSPPACLRRVRRLRERGVIRGEVAVLDARLVGPPMTVVVAVDLVSENRVQVTSFRQRMLAEEAVVQCLYVTGRHDFILVTRVADIAAYEALSQRLFHDDANVKRYESLVVLDEVKRDLAVPVLARSA